MITKQALRSMSVGAAVVAMSAAGASATTIFTDSFEDPANTQNWQVYDVFDNWATTSGTGIEVQTSGTVVDAHDGDQYVELDSDCERGGNTSICSITNSSMTRFLTLSQGTYELEWYYQPRTNSAGDNIISAYIDGASETLFSNLIGTADETTSTQSGWEKFTYTFYVDGSDNDYGLSFRAEGTQNEFGGFIDSVTLSIVPLPAAGWMLLAGLGGMAALRRRQKS